MYVVVTSSTLTHTSHPHPHLTVTLTPHMTHHDIRETFQQEKDSSHGTQRTQLTSHYESCARSFPRSPATPVHPSLPSDGFNFAVWASRFASNSAYARQSRPSGRVLPRGQPVGVGDENCVLTLTLFFNCSTSRSIWTKKRVMARSRGRTSRFP